MIRFLISSFFTIFVWGISLQALAATGIGPCDTALSKIAFSSHVSSHKEDSKRFLQVMDKLQERYGENESIVDMVKNLTEVAIDRRAMVNLTIHWSDVHFRITRRIVDDTLVYQIPHIALVEDGRVLPEKSSSHGYNAGFSKMWAGVSKSIVEDLAQFPEIKSVEITMVEVINKQLEKTLQGLGFRRHEKEFDLFMGLKNLNFGNNDFYTFTPEPSRDWIMSLDVLK